MTTVYPSHLCGEILLPSSKSLAIREIVCALLSKSATQIFISNTCDDIFAALDCAEHLGAKITNSNEIYTVLPPKSFNKKAVLDCRESMTCFNFFVSVCSVIGGEFVFLLSPSLSKRSFPLLDFLSEHGVLINREQNKISISGKLLFKRGKIDLSISSQPLSALMISLSAQNSESEIEFEDLVSKPYVDMTLSVLKDFHADICPERNGFKINPSSLYFDGIYRTSADMSAAVYFYAANALGADIKIKDSADPLQGDSIFYSVAKSILSGEQTVVDISSIPDCVCVLALICCYAKQKVTITNTARLKTKESDRVKSTVNLILSLGGKCEYSDDAITIYPQDLIGGSVCTYGDHRICMTAFIAALFCKGEVRLDNIECISKSYPNFIKDYISLGGKVNVEISR